MSASFAPWLVNIIELVNGSSGRVVQTVWPTARRKEPMEVHERHWLFKISTLDAFRRDKRVSISPTQKSIFVNRIYRAVRFPREIPTGCVQDVLVRRRISESVRIPADTT